MAISVSSDQVLVNTTGGDAESLTNWVVTASWSTAPVLDGDSFLQGANAIGGRASGTGSGTTMFWDHLTTGTANLNLTGSGYHVYFWLKAISLPAHDARVRGGLGISISSGTDVTTLTGTAPWNGIGVSKQWFVSGNDFDSTSGWVCYVVDPATTADWTTGSPDMTSVDRIGMRVNMVQSVGAGSFKPHNILWDRVSYGTKLTITGSTGTFQDIYAVDSLTTNQFGILGKNSGIFLGGGKLVFGTTGQSAPCVMTDSKQTLVWQDFRVATNFYQVQLVGNSAPNTTTMTLGTYAGGLTSGGCTIRGVGLDTQRLIAPVIVSGGTTYVANDILTVVGGTFTVAAQFRVVTVSGGVITAIVMQTAGSYSVPPTGTLTVTDARNSSATFTATAVGGSVWTLIASAANQTLNLYACALSEMVSAVLASTSSIRGCTILNSGTVTPNGAVIDDCTFQDVRTVAPISATYAIVINSTAEMANVTNCKFINCNRAIKITAAGSYTFTGDTFSGNTYDIENTVAATDAVTQTFDVRDADQPLGNSTITAVGQSFSGNGAALANVVFTLSKTNTSTTGNLYVKIYASTGSFPNCLPTGSVLATSQAIDVANLTTTPVATTIYFNTQNQNITLTSGARNYVAVLEYTGTAANYVNVGIDQSFPVYEGNLSTYTSPTWTSAGDFKDAIFKVRTGGVVAVTLASGANPSASKTLCSNAIPGTVTINTGVNITVHVQDSNQADIVGASVQVFQTSTPSNILINTTTNGDGDVVVSTILATGEPLTVRARLSPSDSTRYLPAETSTTVPASNATVTVILNTDSLIGETTSGTIGDNFAVNTSNKSIKNSGTTTYTVNELYTWLMDYFDAADYMDDQIPMSIQTPSEYTLLNGWFLDDASTKYLTQGSIQTSGWNSVIYVLTMSGTPTNPVPGDIGKTVTNGGGTNTGVLLDYTTTSPYKWYIRKVLGTFGAEAVTITPSGTGAGNIITATTEETIWSNIYTLGSLVTGTTLDVYQNDAQITPFWSSGHFDILIRVKETSSLIDSGKIMVLARLYGTLYDNFLITAASGRNPVPLAAFDDGNNDTASATVGAYGGFSFTFGYASKNIGNVNGLQPYDCVVECNYHTLLEIYEYLKYITRTSSSTTLNGVNGECYLAVGDIRFAYDTGVFGPFEEGERIEELAAAGGTTSYYFDGSDAVATDPGSKWFGDDLAFDSDATPSTYASLAASTTATKSSNYLMAEGTNAPAGIATITQVRARINGGGSNGGGSGGTAKATIYTDGAADELGEVTVTVGLDGIAWGSYATLSTPPGGWDWSKVQALEVRCWGTTQTLSSVHVTKIEVEVTYDAVGGGGTYGYLVSLIDGITGTMVLRNVHGTFTDNLGITGTTSNAIAIVNGAPDAITQSKQAPFGTYAGGQFFGARGVWLDHVHADYVNDYELIDSVGVTQAPPATIPVTVSNTAVGDRVSVFRALDANGTIDKTYLQSHASSNTVGLSTYTVAAGTPIPTDTPSAGKIRLRDASTNNEHRIRYASWTGSVFTLITAITDTTTSTGSTNVIHNSGASFQSADILVGDLVRNTTDGSWAHVVSVDSNTKITTTDLAGGSDNTWTSGDSYSFHTLPVTYENATNVDTAYVPYLDSIATGTSVSTSITYGGVVRNISTRVRIKGLQPYTNNISTLTSAGYSTSVTRIDDTIAT